MSHLFKTMHKPRRLAPFELTGDEESAARAEAQEIADEHYALTVMGQLVAQIPTKAQFDDWIAGFPEDTQEAVRAQMAQFCTFPVAEPSSGHGAQGELATGYPASPHETPATGLDEVDEIAREDRQFVADLTAALPPVVTEFARDARHIIGNEHCEVCAPQHRRLQGYRCDRHPIEDGK